METLFISLREDLKRKNVCILFAFLICSGLLNYAKAIPSDWAEQFGSHEFSQWNLFQEDQLPASTSSPSSLACIPNVNVSLNQAGFAVITVVMLVSQLDYPPQSYTVDIMGPLTNTVYCEQLGQYLMVVVTDPSGNSCMSTIHVEDKLRPLFSCTPDILPCNVDVGSIPFEQYVEVQDNCDPDPDLYYSYVIQTLPCNPNGYTAQVLVTWTATDASGNSSTCEDIIYLQKPAIGQIVFPPDVSISCTHPNTDPSITGQPTYNGLPIDYVCQYTVWYNDIVIPMCNGAQKIKRTWTVMDWCTSAIRTDVQEILIIDNNKPNLTCPPSVTISTANNTCIAKYTFPAVTVSDSCAAPADIIVTFQVAGIPGYFSTGQMVNLNVGVKLVTVKATDPCGNFRICQYNVTVRDLVPPIPVCHNLQVSLGPMGMAVLYADLLDFNVVENCGILSKQIWRMNNNCGVPEDLQPGPDVKFCCADIGTNVMVGFKVTDVSGNMNTCMFQVTVKDQLPPVAHCKDITISVQDGGVIVVDPGQINNNSTDNCTIVDLDLTPNTFDCEDVGVNVVVLTVTDQSGNTSTCSATVTIVDEIPPVAECHDLTVTVDEHGHVSIIADQIDNGSTDNCAIDTIFLNQYDFDCDDEGQNIVKLTVVDFAGNMDMCTAIVTVLTSPPVAICQDATVSLGPDGTVTINANIVNNGSFDDCGQITLTVNPPTFDCGDIGENVVVLTVTDGSGNTSTCTAIVTVEDNTPPIALCHDITVMLDENGHVDITGVQIDNGSTDNCDTIFLSVTPPSFDCEDVGDNIVVLTVTDASGNTSTCTAHVMVAMPDPPNAICQNVDVTLNQNGTITIDPEIVDGGSTTQCGDLSFDVDPDTFDCDDLGPNIVVLTVTDEAGATSTCTAIVTVHENPPVAHCQNITVNLGPDGTVTINASQVNNNSTDDCPPFTLMVTPSTFDCTDIGPNIVTLTVTDQSGFTSTCTSTVTVQDVTPPIPHCHDITVVLNSNGTITITGAQIDNGSTDNCSIISLTVTPNTFDCQDIGPNLVTLTVTDQSGNTATCTATVTVEPPPPSALCQDITVSLGSNGIVVILPEDVSGGGNNPCNNLDLDLDEDTFDCTEIGPNIVTLTVTDQFGNSATCTATVTVVDDDAPNCNAQDITVNLNSSGIATINANDINDGSTDNCEIVSITVTPTSFDCGDVGPNIVTLTVTDQSGNSSTCTATVTVIDNIDPTCSTVDITVSLGGNGMVTILPEDVDDGSTDNCPPVTLDVDPDTFDCDDIGDNVVVLTVTDASGNTSTCTAIVTVDDSGGLQASCQNVTIFVDVNGNAHVDPQQVNNGSGGGCNSGTLDFDLSQTDFNCSDLGPNIVTLTVTDDNGNTATCTAIITVADNIPPTISCPANLSVACNTVNDPNNTAQFGNATGNDNCSVTVTETHVLNLNSCGVGTISRTFTATDNSGNTATCTQLVTIFNSDPFDASDITWPTSPVSVNICNSTDPEDIPNGEPTFSPNSLQCANIVVNHSDVTQMFIDNNPNSPCKVITRTWTVTDLCQNNATFTFVQTINVQDMVAPLFTNINDMTKVANSNCVAFFTLIASATDCAGVTITNNSPYGVNNGSNASGNYPIGVTVVLFTATDGCGNISTMDVVITVTDPDPTEFQCEKVVFFLPPETEISVNAHQFVTFFEGNCTGEDDFIVSYSNTNPFDTVHIYDCGDVGVQTFPLYFWDITGMHLVDSCGTADIEIRDPNDFCMDGLVVMGDVENEDGIPVTDVQVSIANVPMTPDTTDIKGNYAIDGLDEQTGYKVAAFNDLNHKAGVSTLDLVLIQKHLLGRAKLNSPYKIIAADANHSGVVTALDLLDMRKLILGITNRFPNNTSWRFVDKAYVFPDPYNPFKPGFPESVWIDSVTNGIDTINFTGVKIGDVNGSFFSEKVTGEKIEPRSSNAYEFNYAFVNDNTNQAQRWEIRALSHQAMIEGLQVSVLVGPYSQDQVKEICSDIIPADQWYYDPVTMTINVSFSPAEQVDLEGKLILCGPVTEWSKEGLALDNDVLVAEAYAEAAEGIQIHPIMLESVQSYTADIKEYHLFQNIPNPFSDGTLIRFMLPKDEDVQIIIHDITGRLILEKHVAGVAGMNEVPLRSTELGASGIYYFTLQSINASMTRKMSFTNN